MLYLSENKVKAIKFALKNASDSVLRFMNQKLKTFFPLSSVESADFEELEGFAAEKMLEIARQNKIPIVENENLANVLSVENIGQLIPESLYEAVANIFAFISSTERKM